MAQGKIIHNQIYSIFNFNGTPDSEGVVVTDVPLDGYVPVSILSDVNRDGWLFQFYMDTQDKSPTYWAIRFISTTGTIPTGNFTGHVCAIKI